MPIGRVNVRANDTMVNAVNLQCDDLSERVSHSSHRIEKLPGFPARNKKGEVSILLMMLLSSEGFR
jgi:hypothetical protein